MNRKLFSGKNGKSYVPNQLLAIGGVFSARYLHDHFKMFVDEPAC